MARIENHTECQYAGCDVCDLSEHTLAEYATNLLNQGSRDGLAISDRNIGLTHGIILSRSNAGVDDIDDSNFRVMTDDLEACKVDRDGYSAIDEDVYVGTWSGFGGGEWLIVRVYVPECTETTTGEHDGRWVERESGYESACAACGADYNDDDERVYTEAFAYAVHLSNYIREYGILSDDDWSELSNERDLEALDDALDTCSKVMAERHPDDDDADRLAVFESVRDNDDVWDYPILHSSEHWVDEDELLKLWETVRDNYIHAKEHAPVPGQLVLELIQSW